VLGVGEDGTLSQPVTVDLASLFSSPTQQPISLEELTVSANQPLSNVSRLQWSTQPKPPPGPAQPIPQPSTNFQVVLTPMSIRTFVIKMQH
jgi:hypothetical protein